MKKVGTLITIGTLSSAPAATILELTKYEGVSDSSSFGGSVANTLNDPFAYNPYAPVAELPQQTFNPGAAGFHANVGNGIVVDIHYRITPPVTIVGAEPIFVLDLYGRSEACCLDRDDNIFVEIFNNGSIIGRQFGLQIPSDNNFWVRATFDTLPLGATFDEIHIGGVDSGGGSSANYFTLMEVRAATISSIPEPTSLALTALAGLVLFRRMR